MQAVSIFSMYSIGIVHGLLVIISFKCNILIVLILDIIDRTVEDLRSFENNPVLKQIMIAQRATFVNRYAAQLKMCAGNHVCFLRDSVLLKNEKTSWEFYYKQ